VGTDLYPHMPSLRVASALDVSAIARATPACPAGQLASARGPRACRFVRFFCFGGAKFPQNVRFPALNADEPRHAKFDAAIALSSAEISVTVQTLKQTVNDIGLSTPCLSASVDKNSSGDDIANVNYLTTISHTRRPTSKYRKRDQPTSFNKLDDR